MLLEQPALETTLNVMEAAIVHASPGMGIGSDGLSQLLRIPTPYCCCTSTEIMMIRRLVEQPILQPSEVEQLQRH